MTSEIIGASEAAKALGMSSFGSAYEWWMERTGRIARGPTTRPQALGIKLEPVILTDFEERNDVRLIRPVAPRHHVDHAWMRATPDGLLIRENCSQQFIERHDVQGDEVIVVDAKSTLMQADVPQSIISAKWGDMWTDIIPDEYAVQLQQQMIVFDGYQGFACRRGMLTAWIQGRAVADYAVPAVPAFQAMLVEKLSDISFRHLVCDEPMLPSTKDDWDNAADAAMRKMLAKKGDRRPATDTERDAMIAYHEARQAEKIADEKKAQARALLIASIGDGYGIESEAWRASLSEGSGEVERVKAGAVLDEIETLPLPENIRAAIARIKKTHTTTGWAGRRLTVTEKKV